MVSTVEVDGVPLVVVPLRSHLAPVTALVAVTRPDADLLDVQDRDLFAGFADQVALSLDRTQALADRQELALISDRERIARDLHDIVIQRLFATGLQLQGVAAMTGDGPVAERLDRSVADLDDTIKAIRGTIFELQDRSGDSLRAGIRGLVKEYVPVLGFTPGRPHVRPGRHGRAAGARAPSCWRCCARPSPTSRATRSPTAPRSTSPSAPTCWSCASPTTASGCPTRSARAGCATRGAARRPGRDPVGLAGRRPRHRPGLARPARVRPALDLTRRKARRRGASGFRGLLVTAGRGGSPRRPHGSTSDPAPTWCRPHPGRGPPSRSRRRGGRRRPGCSPAAATRRT